MSKNDGGPAFPGTKVLHRGMYDELRPTEGVNRARELATSSSPGMPLRDYFAATIDIPWNAVLDTLLVQKGISAPTVAETVAARATMRYLEADAMLKAREDEKP